MPNSHLSVAVAGSFLLDAPYARLDVNAARARRTAARASFAAFLNNAEENGVRYVAFAGGLLSADFCTSDTVEFLTGEFRKHPDVTFLIAPSAAESVLLPSVYAAGILPKNVLVFSEKKPTRFDFDDVTFYGFAADVPDAKDKNAFTCACLASMRAAEDERAHILVCPTDKPDARDTEAAAAFGADAVFFGNEEATGMQTYKKHPLILTAGAAEGHGFETPDFGGAVTLTVKETERGRSFSAAFRITSAYRYMTLPLETDGISGEKEWNEAVSHTIAESGFTKDTYLRVIVSGTTAPDFFPPDYGECDTLYGLLVTDNTLPTGHAEFYRRDMSVAGEIYRTFEPGFRREESLERRTVVEAFRIGLAALEDRDRD